MQINKYTRYGKDVDHDVHYSEVVHGREVVGRYGSDDEPSDRLQKAFDDMTELCSSIAGKPVMIRRIQWSRGSNSKTELTVEGIMSAGRGGSTMKVQLPKFGYAKGFETDPITGQMHEALIPSGMIRVQEIDTITELEAALVQYVRQGSGQLEFEFTQESYTKATELLQKAGEDLKKSGATSASFSVVNRKGEEQKIACSDNCGGPVAGAGSPPAS
jgi:hypothetical protein